MKRVAILVLIVALISCKMEEKFLPKSFSESKITRELSKVKFKSVLRDSLLNIRAIEVNSNEGLGFFATSKGEIGAFSLLDDEVNILYRLQYDSMIPNFRSLALTNSGAFALSVGSPTLLYQVKKNFDSLVYMENHPNTFYDSMEFWNDKEGIAIGDPTDDCMSVIITRDGGNTWTKLSCDNLPKSKKGEAAFAASDTNISIVDNHTWVATGGKSSRILYSPNKGETWEAFDTPIVQGKATTGIYSIDFYDELHGFAIGGDYTKPTDNKANKIRTANGGKTWELVAQNQEPGYRSCVQYIPNSRGKELVAVGFNGIDYSNDSGSSWKRLSNQGFYTIRFLNDSIAYAAGKGRISKLIFEN